MYAETLENFQHSRQPNFQTQVITRVIDVNVLFQLHMSYVTMKMCICRE
jgi:hypothetical protein